MTIIGRAMLRDGTAKPDPDLTVAIAAVLTSITATMAALANLMVVMYAGY